MQLTKDQLKACMPYASAANIDRFLHPLNDTMAKYQINTPARAAMFLAQLAHESGSLRYVEEIASGEAYEGRKDLGNTEPGDGKRFKGRGLIQITGRANYRAVGKALAYDFLSDPEAMEKPGAAAMVSGWFWDAKGLNTWADKGDFKRVTKIINGGYTNYEDRVKHYNICKKALGIKEISYE